MSLESRKEALRKEIERKQRYLQSIEAMPDLEAMVDGTVLAMTVTYGNSRPYPVIGYKAGGTWHLTGANSPNKISSDNLTEWLMSQGRHLGAAVVLAEFTVEVNEFDLGEAMLAVMRENTHRVSEWRESGAARLDAYGDHS